VWVLLGVRFGLLFGVVLPERRLRLLKGGEDVTTSDTGDGLAEAGEVLHDRGSEPDEGWFILGADGYFDVDNATWCEFSADDAPWTTEWFEFFGTVPRILAARSSGVVTGEEAERLQPTADNTDPHGLDWRDGLDALDALLDDCAQHGVDHKAFVRVSAVRDIVNAVRRYEDDTDESIERALWEDAVERDEPWTRSAGDD
jgi:hypothetical protein